MQHKKVHHQDKVGTFAEIFRLENVNFESMGMGIQKMFKCVEI